MASFSADPTPLAQPLYFEFAHRSAPNRFLKAALTERMCTWHPTNLTARGVPTKEIINLYRRWGEGGAGVILTGNILTDYEHLEALGNPIISRDAPFHGERFERFQELATVSKKHGSLIVAQVNHPGRQVDEWIQPHPISASDVQLQKAMGMTFGKPRAATKEDIEGFIEAWTHAAEYLYRAGYDGIQLHAAHGYLLAQFISKTTNKRTDEYGGSIRNRARLILEIAASIRRRVPNSFIVGIKLNSVEFQEEGLSPGDCRRLCSMLENEGRFDFVELSGGSESMREQGSFCVLTWS
jgi:2,4-dienoyl-CoA reductase-like NADH-dependent reductase (Old Yellow Enzyme family)